MLARTCLAAVVALCPVAPVAAQPVAAQLPAATRSEDVIYGRRDNLALTLDVFAPKGKPNGAGVIICISGDFKSDKMYLGLAERMIFPEFLDRGYTVFAVMHGSQPRVTVPEIVADTHRAVRFIRASAKKYGVNPEKLGIAGMSSGGHLSLMMGVAGKPGDPKADDPVERESSKVAAVACFFPVTDFQAFEANPPQGFEDLFPLREFDAKAGKFTTVTPERRREIGRDCSPLHCATRDAAPVRILHGDKDKLVPLDQSERLIEKLKTFDVVCELGVKKGMEHSARQALPYLPEIREWFDTYLLEKK
ncbi:alpha/beta hydrolase fold domain-containing protein [Gemmata sp.]|uniref:alpha/beta hydrolase fold domain-containing protein n=1 Tax=Gemmata sp. TaxID=1914242 RepID=UPI003F7225B3